MAEVRMHGLEALKQTLNALPAKLGERAVRAALRAGAQTIRKQAQANAPVLQTPSPHRIAGTIKANITVRKSKRDKYGVYVSVKPLTGKQILSFRQANGGAKGANNPNDPFYWVFQEFGTAHHAASPFMRPAYEEKKYEALQQFEGILKKRVVKEAEKIAREASMPR